MKPLKSLLLSVPLAVAACGASPGDPPQARLLDEHAKITTQDPSSTQSFVITQSTGTVALMRASEGFCYITSFTGDLDSESQQVHLDIDSGGTWNVAVDDVKPDPTNQIAVTVACTAFHDFTPFGGGAISRKFSAWAEFSDQLGRPVGELSIPLPTSSERCFLTGFGGMFNGSGESVNIDPRGNLAVNNEYPGGEATLGDARCIQLATTGGGLMMPSTSVTRTLSQGSSAVDLIPASQGVCFMTGITGRFRGQGEGATIAVNGATGNWQMSVRSSQQDVAFTASCIPFDQGLKVINAVNAGSPRFGPVHVRWAMNPGANVTSWTVSTTTGGAITVAPDPFAPNSFEVVTAGFLSDQVQVCATLPSSLVECSAPISPKDSTKAEWYDITNVDILATGSGAGFASSGITNVPWAQASSAAFAFCQGVGFPAGQMNGQQDAVHGLQGVVCYGDNAVFENTRDSSNPTVTGWNFYNVDSPKWAFAARTASDICTTENPGSMGGWFNGNQSGAFMGLACYHAPAHWFDVTPGQLAASYTSYISTQPGHTLDDVPWDLAARAADSFCRTCQSIGWCSDAYVGGRFNGYYSATTLGLVCY